MTNLFFEAELRAMRKACCEYWERSAYNTPNAFEREKYEITFGSGWRTAREYSKQREEKLWDLMARAVDFESSSLRHRQWLREVEAALAENRDNAATRQEWHENRIGLLNRFCEIDTSDWDEGDFFHFLEKPWQSQYEVEGVPGELGHRRPA